MSRRCFRTVWIAAAALLAGSLLAMDTSDADRAFDAGDHDRALALYDDVLESDPNDPHALLRSGLLLSWERRFDEAIERYDRLLEVEPAHAKARLERAKVLSWDGRYGDGARAFREILVADPGHREARLGLARCRSWSGRQEAARAEYRGVLRDHPGDPEALVGVAQTYAWSGDPGRARVWYRRALEADPGNRAAELGLGYLDVGAGDFEEADERIERLEERFPEDDEIRALRSAYRDAGGPDARASWDRVEDTDDNRLDIYRIEGGLGLRRDLRLVLGAARWDMRSPSGRAAVDSLFGVLHWRPVRGHRLALRAGSDRRESTAGETTSSGIGGVRWEWQALPLWRVGASAQRDTFRYSPEILDNDIMIDAYEAFADGRPGERWEVEAALGSWDLSDANSRTHLRAGVWFHVPIPATRLTVGYAFRYMDYDEDRDNGYFDPSGFTSHVARARAAGRFGNREFYYEAGVEAGFQSFDRMEPVPGPPPGTVETSVRNDRVLGGYGLFGVPLAGGFALELYAAKTDYALASAAGFESTQYSVRLRWRRGP